MIFRKNKPASEPPKEPVTPRGRERPAGGGDRGTNALARRFLEDEEPATIDLSGSRVFHADTPEPETRTGETEPGAPRQPATASSLISFDSGDGSFFVHPGPPEMPVLLEGATVTERTELRKGDRIRVGEAEIVFLAR